MLKTIVINSGLQVSTCLQVNPQLITRIKTPRMSDSRFINACLTGAGKYRLQASINPITLASKCTTLQGGQKDCCQKVFRIDDSRLRITGSPGQPGRYGGECDWFSCNVCLSVCGCVWFCAILMEIIKSNSDHKVTSTQLKTTEHCIHYCFVNCNTGGFLNIAVIYYY